MVQKRGFHRGTVDLSCSARRSPSPHKVASPDSYSAWAVQRAVREQELLREQGLREQELRHQFGGAAVGVPAEMMEAHLEMEAMEAMEEEHLEMDEELEPLQWAGGGEGFIEPAPVAGKRVLRERPRAGGEARAVRQCSHDAEQAMRPPGRANQLAEQAMQAMHEEQQEQQHLAEQAMQAMQEEQQAAINELKQQLTNAQVQLAEQEDMPVSECVICLDEARIGLRCGGEESHFICAPCLNDFCESEAADEPRRVEQRGGRIFCPLKRFDGGDGGCDSCAFDDVTLARVLDKKAFAAVQKSRHGIVEAEAARRADAVSQQQMEAKLRQLEELGVEVFKHCEHIREEILTMKCPRCSAAFFDCTRSRPLCVFFEVSRTAACFVQSKVAWR